MAEGKKSLLTYLAKLVISTDDGVSREVFVITKSTLWYVKISGKGVCLLEKTVGKQYKFHFDSLRSQKFFTVMGVKTRKWNVVGYCFLE